MSTVFDKIRDSDIGGDLRGLEVFQKICDPLLANHHYPSIAKKAYFSKSKNSLENQYS
jgi:hypothetical protein